MKSQTAVLYVEDEPMSRKVMQMLLKGRMGLEHVTIFEDSNNFIQRLCNLVPLPDVIFLDIHMEPYNGFELLEMVRNVSYFASTPVVALTASVMSEEVELLKSAGFDGCLAKPINSDTFGETLQQIMNGERVWQIIS
ncbi:MAG: response regulator [Chloroflexi bacterium]|nr:response regulator [Chloroflexota bacterium]